MIPTQLSKFKQILLEEIEKTQAKILELQELCKPIPPENSIGRVSRMDAINNKSITQSVLRKSLNKLQELKKIESKTSNPDFGKCYSCNKTIQFGRLIIQPQSKLCVKCAK